MLNRFSLQLALFLTFELLIVLPTKADLEVFYENSRYSFTLQTSDDFFTYFDIYYLSDNGDGITLVDRRHGSEVKIYGSMNIDGDVPVSGGNRQSYEGLLSPNFPFAILSFGETHFDGLVKTQVILAPIDQQEIYTLHIDVNEASSDIEISGSIIGEIVRRVHHKDP